LAGSAEALAAADEASLASWWEAAKADESAAFPADQTVAE